MGGGLHEPHPGARCHRYRCSLPGLAEFTANRRGGTHTGHHNEVKQGGDYAGFGRGIQVTRRICALMQLNWIQINEY